MRGEQLELPGLAEALAPVLPGIDQYARQLAQAAARTRTTTA